MERAGKQALSWLGEHWWLVLLVALALIAYLLLRSSSASASSGATSGTVSGTVGAEGAQGAPGAPGKTGPAGKAGSAGKTGASTEFGYTTHAGETFAQVARAYGVSVPDLANANPGMAYGKRHPNGVLKAGETITVPRSRASVVAAQKLRAKARA